MDVRDRRQALDALDGKLLKFYETVDLEIPEGGWLKAIRVSLGMSLAQLATRLGRTPVTVREIEEREASKAVSLKKLIEVGDALGLRFVYGFVPKAGTLEHMVRERAYMLAGRIVRQKAPPLLYELRKYGGTRLRRMIEEKADELRREMPKSFWDDTAIKKPRAHHPGPFASGGGPPTSLS
jgi:predicted DNA-binding mobile mystery protein A